MYTVFINFESGHPEYVSKVDTIAEAFEKAVYYFGHAMDCYEELDDPMPVSTIIYKEFGGPVAEVYSPNL